MVVVGGNVTKSILIPSSFFLLSPVPYEIYMDSSSKSQLGSGSRGI